MRLTTNTGICILVSSLVSLVGALLVFFTFYLHKVWRMEFDSKFILFMMSLYIVGYCVTYISFIETDFNTSGLKCTIQACLIQYFGVGIMLHEAMIAYDLFDTIDKLSRGEMETNLSTITMETEAVDQSRSTLLLTYFRKIPKKYIAFEIFVFVFNLVGAICVHRFHNASDEGPGIYFNEADYIHIYYSCRLYMYNKAKDTNKVYILCSSSICICYYHIDV